MHTEEETKELWCPFTRAQGNGCELSHNRPDGSYNCIASGCAAWRWESERSREKCFHVEQPPDPNIWERVSPLGGIGVWPTYRRKERRGYCGLASRPE